MKHADDKSPYIAELERLLQIAPADRKRLIEKELRIIRAGIKGEQEASYFIDFDAAKSENRIVIHDLRIEVDGRVAQIDHLMINRMLYVFVLETKHFSSGLKVTEDGEFLRWNSMRRTYEGMPSPLTQNDRHIAVLKDLFERVDMPFRLGRRLSPTFHSYVLVSPQARVIRPRGFDTSKVIKADSLEKTLDAYFDKVGVFEAFGSLSKLIPLSELEKIGRQLVAFHKPIEFDYAARFGLNEVAAAEVDTEKPVCRFCASQGLQIQHGRYGYYFKCTSCDGNTPIKIGCGQAGHKERIRKDGIRFYRECADCGTSSLFYVNPA